MTIFELKKHFKQEISSQYSESESATLFIIFFHRIVGYDRYQQRRFMNQQLLKSHIEDMQTIMNELKTGKPYQHLLGETEFYGLKFIVNENVLVPRPETEELLEIAIHKLQELNAENLKILDIGTGSGIIPIVLKKHFPQSEVSTIDISEKALKVARINAKSNETEINFTQKDFLNEELTEIFDVIISNPPYIGIDEESEIANSVKEFEPKIALFSPTNNALIFYEKIAEACKNHLSENGMVFLEINQKLGKETLQLFENVLTEVKLVKDLSGNDRFIVGRK